MMVAMTEMITWKKGTKRIRNQEEKEEEKEEENTSREPRAPDVIWFTNGPRTLERYSEPSCFDQQVISFVVSVFALKSVVYCLVFAISHLTMNLMRSRICPCVSNTLQTISAALLISLKKLVESSNCITG